jgi:two-component sensor histidine kinase
VVIVDGKIKRYINIRNGLANDFVWYISSDRQGNLYFCTDGGGISQYRPGVYTTYNNDTGLPDNTVWCIRESNLHQYYFATDKGVAVLQNGKFHTISTEQGLSDDMIITLHSMEDGTLFFGTSDRGVDVYHRGTFRSLNVSNGLTSNSVWSITEDSRERIYLGTYDGGICVYHNGMITDTLNSEDGLANDYVVSSYAGADGTLYFGLDHGGVSIVRNGHLVKDEIYLPGLTVWSVYQTKDGNLYFGTDKHGLISFTSAGYDTITIADGLSNNCILGVMEGEKGLFYLTTDNGVNVVDLRDKPAKIRIITSNDGLASRECNQGAYFKDNQGRLWIGTIQGVTCYNPIFDEPVKSPLPTHITAMTIFDREIFINEDYIKTPFKYHENYIKFNFIGIDLRSAYKVSYRYRLNHSEGEWINTEYPQIQFANLKNDEYRFEVQSRSEWDVWSKTASITFTILPPFWATWWFRTLMVLVITGVIASVVFYRIRQLLAVERLRAKIAADLHDDIGAGLSEINILTSVAKTKTPEEAKKYTKNELNRIARTAGELIDSMSDIVWLVNPKKDSMTDLVTRLKDIFNDLLDAKSIKFSSDNIHLLSKIKLDMERRQYIFLIFKEALNNALKYSQCTEVDFSVSVVKNKLSIILSDNGIGFDLSNHKEGNGLKNMKVRAEKIKSNLYIESQPGKGTRLIFNGKI